MTRVRAVRWKIEGVVAMLFAIATIVTAAVPRWIEALGLEPDGGDGSAEWGLVVALGAAAVVAAYASRRHYARRSGMFTLGEGSQG